MGIRAWAVRRGRRAVVQEVRATRNAVEVLPEQGLFNLRCHQNSVEYLRTHPDRDLEVAEVMMVDRDGDPILHYVVRDRASGAFLEVTLGFEAADPRVEYYLLRYLRREDHPHVVREFWHSLEYWAHRSVGRTLCRLLHIDRVT